jgi:hypothetical protein
MTVNRDSYLRHGKVEWGVKYDEMAVLVSEHETQTLEINWRAPFRDLQCQNIKSLQVTPMCTIITCR